MNERMTHRGPDDEGVFVEPRSGVGLGARRLSVIDLAGGHQPLANEDGTIWVVLNGEIYNFRALRERLLTAGHVFETRSDTEVLVHLYEEYGDALVHDLEGMYAFALWDSRRRRLLLVRDRFGEKPLFYRQAGGVLTFASELTALLASSGGCHELNADVVDAFFIYGYVPGGASIVEGVRQLAPGERLAWDADSRSGRLESYWRPPVHEPSALVDVDRLVEQTAELLDRAVESRMVAEVPLGVFLSGGLDSTLVAEFAARHTKGRLKTFTVDYDVGEFGEGACARAAAAAIGTDHHELIMTTADVSERVPAMLAGLDQPIADPAYVPLRALSEFARGEVTVAIGGEGADELFGGYPRYRWLGLSARVPRYAPRRIPALAAAGVGRMPGLGRVGRLSDAMGPGSTFDRHLGWVTSNRALLRQDLYGPRLADALATDRGRAEPPGVDLANGDVMGSLMRLDQTHWLPDDVLAKADRASMGASLELRAPFLSRDLAEFAASVPASLHVRGGGKFLLRRVLAAALPTLGTGSAKVAFRTPCAEWLRGPLASTLSDQVAESPLYKDGWFERTTVVSWIERHRVGRDDLSTRLWPLLVLGCWVGESTP